MTTEIQTNRQAASRAVWAKRREGLVTVLPADANPIIGWPEYAIQPSGVVWRVAPNKGVDARRGPVPRVVQPVMTGSATVKQSPSVKLSRFGCVQARTIKSLVRQHFGDAPCP